MKKILVRILLPVGLIFLILFLNLLFSSIIASKITEGEPITPTGSGRTALLVIDIQEGTTGVVSETKAYTSRSAGLIRNINLLLDEALEREWSVIYIRSEVVNPLINVLNNTLARGSEGAKPDGRLAVKPGATVIKHRNDAFNRTDLDRILTENRVEHLVVAGLDAERCIRSTVMAALNRGYRVSVIRDAVIARTGEGKTEALEQLRVLGVEISDVSAFLSSP
jgi:nicotinamidase/pyrazinamidase